MRRRELPRRENSMVCARFAATGCCKTFNSHGHCSLHHPLNIHSIIQVTARCPICSLPKPCAKCDYYKRRAHLVSFVEAKKAETCSYKNANLPEVLALADKKFEAATRAHQKSELKDKIKERGVNCKTGIDKIETQLDQIDKWLTKNSDCNDSELYKAKTKWITKNVEKAFYAVDRALEEWRGRREKDEEEEKKGRGRK